jgi:acyl-coenzyme A synthetase/AMP-(fatty) acid ligase
MRGSVNDSSLGIGNVAHWMRDQGADLHTPRLWLDRPWTSPDGRVLTTLSLEDILSAAAAYRDSFRQMSLEAGDIVAVRLRNPIEVYLIFVGLAAHGIIAALENPNLRNETASEYGARIGARGEIIDVDGRADDGAPPFWRQLTPSDSAAPVSMPPPSRARSGDEPAHAYEPADIVLLCHTSGTTGLPKAVSCSHQGFMAGIRAQMGQPSSPLFGRTVLNALPAAHHAWLMTITWALLSGTRLVLAADQSAQTVIQDVERFAPDSIRSFSCTLRDVARLDLPAGALGSVGLWMSTGDVNRRSDIAIVSALGTRPVAGPSGIVRRPGMLVLDGFGSTELGHLHFSVLHAPGCPVEARCIGRPASFVSAAILSEDGKELPDGDIGYLAVRSGAVTPGYWKDPERTEKSRLGGYWITGDVGYRDRFGRYFHLDRHSDVIQTAQGAVYSVRSEEELIRSIADIERCAIVGRTDGSGETRAVCLLEPANSARDQQSWHRLINTVLTRMELAAVSETIVLSPGALQIGPTGKIRKFLCRARPELSALS